jgi:cyclophilin family peptidyl-prolyl cis-trans isomerase
MEKKTSSSRKRSRPISKKQKQPNKDMLILLGIVVVIVVAIAGVLLLVNNDTNDDTNGINKDLTAIINTSMGTITVDLYENKTPNTVNNFVDYANNGFYDGLVFHRVIDGFMIQGGGFYPDGTKKQTDDPIDLEIHPDARHVDGAIAMARTSNPDSATSQFFIDDGAQPSLEPGGVDPNGYAVFGVVTDGMEVVRSISAVDTTSKYGRQDWPVNDVIINSVTIEE